jgi:glycosyltransferase involved in cell wall biosynthesis
MSGTAEVTREMSSSPQVTVVVPVWDRYVAFLPRCLEGILEEPAGKPHVIVVDNASNELLPALDPAIDVVRSPRRLSVGAARNLGLSLVETREVIFCDADDRLLPGATAFLSSRMAKRPELVAVICRYVSWNPKTEARAVLERSPRPIVFRVARYRRLFALANLRYNCFPVVGGILRTDAVRDAGGFGDGDVGEDWILGAQLTFRGPIEFHPEPSFLRRVHSGSLWYRAHTHDDYLARCNLLRERIERDRSVPRWVKAGLPLLAVAHRRDVARAMRGSAVMAPANPLLGSGGSAE